MRHTLTQKYAWIISNVYLKHQMCHCLSRAINAWPSINLSPHPPHLFRLISVGLAGFCSAGSLNCCNVVSLVGLAFKPLLETCCNGWCWPVFCCCFAGASMHFSHRISLPVLVTLRKIVCFKSFFFVKYTIEFHAN